MELTDYLAVYGAGLSTAIAVWNYFRSRPKVRVLLTFATGGVDGEVTGGVGISVQNPSTHTAHITNVSFLYSSTVSTFRDRIKHLVKFKRVPRNHGWCHTALSNYGLSDGCPVSIEPGKAHWIFVPDNVIQKLLSDAISPHVKVVVQDALWRNKYSRKFKYPIPKKMKLPQAA